MAQGNNKYDKDAVISIIVEYFFKYDSAEYIDLPFNNVYNMIVDYARDQHPDTAMPSMLQARTYLIRELEDADSISPEEKLTTAVAYRIKDFYIDADEIEVLILKTYGNHDIELEIYNEDPIICTVKLADESLLKLLTTLKSNRSNSEKNVRYSRIDLVLNICKAIKKKSDQILAVVPEFNRLTYLNEKGKLRSDIYDVNKFCTSLCLFVKNTPKGRRFITKLKQSIAE